MMWMTSCICWKTAIMVMSIMVVFLICNKEGTLIYTDCWRMPVSSTINMMLETKTAEGKDVLKLVNEKMLTGMGVSRKWKTCLSMQDPVFGTELIDIRNIRNFGLRARQI